MLQKVLFAATLAVVTAPSATGAMAEASADFGKQYVRPATHSAPQHPAALRAVPPIVFRGPGYLYVPRVGIVDEACNLPTSACPNEMRDVR